MDEYLTPAQAAVLYGLTVEHLAQLRWRKTGPAYYRLTPRKIRYTRAGLDAWIKRSLVDPVGVAS